MAEIKLYCHECGIPYAALQKGHLVVKSRHHGQCHVNVIAVAELVKRCQEDAEGQEVLLLSPLAVET